MQLHLWVKNTSYMRGDLVYKCTTQASKGTSVKKQAHGRHTYLVLSEYKKQVVFYNKKRVFLL